MSIFPALSVRLVAATHSAAFLRGCVESAASTSIVRVTYERATGAAAARVLTASELRPLLHEPLLHSTRALEGLFHRAVVVGESDADRAFYDELNRRLLEVGRGIADAQFVNAQNWSTEARIVGPLRRLGVPAAAILDTDALWEPSNTGGRSIARLGSHRVTLNGFVSRRCALHRRPALRDEPPASRRAQQASRWQIGR